MNTNLKKLIQILSDGGFHSGTVLGQALDLTRAGIWKLVQQLQAVGIPIVSRTNKGYQIPGGLELLSEKRLQSHITPERQAFIQKIILLDQVSSTNDFLLQYLKTSTILDDKAVICLAEGQTAARGRFGRRWEAPYASNLYLSLLWSFPMGVAQLSGLSLVVALSVVRALQRYGIQESIGVKWPNDILWQGKKLAGCLIETQGEVHDVCYAVIGIGLNLNMPWAIGQTIQRQWVDIKHMIHDVPERNRMAGILIDELLKVLYAFQHQGLEPFKEAWMSFDVALHQPVSVVTASGVVKGTYLGIHSNGCLLIQRQTDQKVQSFSSGEVSLQL